jgi:prepilin-type N-terminal cleavage/methylation domain-containing protein
MHRRKGFTLIELLVVIAIIAILAAILFPVFAQARAKARQASCTSNVKQLSLGFQMYTQDYDEHFPYWSWTLSDPFSSGHDASIDHFESIWFNAIYPYVKNSGIYSCPSANDHTTLSQNSITGWADTSDMTKIGINQVFDNTILNYGMNERLHDGSAFGNGGSVSMAAMNYPADTLVVADCTNPLTTGWLPDSTHPEQWDYVLSRVAYPNLPPGGWNNTATCGACQLDIPANAATSPYVDLFDQQTRHNAFSLIGFGDGHAKAVRGRTITLRYLNGQPKGQTTPQ